MYVFMMLGNGVKKNPLIINPTFTIFKSSIVFIGILPVLEIVMNVSQQLKTRAVGISSSPHKLCKVAYYNYFVPFINLNILFACNQRPSMRFV